MPREVMGPDPIDPDEADPFVWIFLADLLAGQRFGNLGAMFSVAVMVPYWSPV